MSMVYRYAIQSGRMFIRDIDADSRMEMFTDDKDEAQLFKSKNAGWKAILAMQDRFNILTPCHPVRIYVPAMLGIDGRTSIAKRIAKNKSGG